MGNLALTYPVYRVGGGSRLSGLMLAAATGAVMMIGPKVISFLRRSSYNPTSELEPS
jgi:zinc transporter ZupT